MANDFFQASGTPADGSKALSSPVRSEFDSIESGFNKMPVIASHASHGVTANGAADALESVPNATYNSRIGSLASTTKDVADGYVGLTLFKLNFKNVLDTFTSFFTNSNTSAKTYTFPDKSGVVQTDTNVQPWGRRNFIINGNFDFWQRATSQTSSGYGSNDRWYDGHSGLLKTTSRQAFTVGQTDVPGNPKYFSRTEVTNIDGAANYAIKEQRIENVRSLSGQRATLTFYAKADAAKNIAIDFDQYFGTGGAPDDDVVGIGAQLIPLTTAWQKFTITVSIPSILGKTLGSSWGDYWGDDALILTFWFNAGSNYDSRSSSLGHQSGTFDIAQVQLEAGTSSTEFELRDYAVELKLCQRFYQIARSLFSGKVTSGSQYRNIAHLATPMRIFNYAVTGASVTRVKFQNSYNVVNAQTLYLYTRNTANASGAGADILNVRLDAEL